MCIKEYNEKSLNKSIQKKKDNSNDAHSHTPFSFHLFKYKTKENHFDFQVIKESQRK